MEKTSMGAYDEWREVHPLAPSGCSHGLEGSFI